MQQSESPPIEGFSIEVESALRAHELVNVRVLFAQKKKEAKAVGLRMAEAVKAELVQVIGHTYLLYRPADPPKIDLAKLTAPLNGKE
ncbi:hypothetical protein NSK_000668 [Nannochloropsis salina CCMP1776]|uniref:CRM domain-containing protein n=1 Tax=Nannochloropsis salina CCMP1776 TaxID=1027361 RepID=A0A4D9DHL6_9STRA|nr:hypothetical protein NSK_000668 [Nannochloropsis salina CCMP1776]|eukprot:TFJ88319.1 hypothetical protein NSK_000668 [Nannochloropsis salina CCMP1776]